MRDCCFLALLNQPGNICARHRHIFALEINLMLYAYHTLFRCDIRYREPAWPCSGRRDPTGHNIARRHTRQHTISSTGTCPGIAPQRLARMGYEPYCDAGILSTLALRIEQVGIKESFYVARLLKRHCCGSVGINRGSSSIITHGFGALPQPPVQLAAHQQSVGIIGIGSDSGIECMECILKTVDRDKPGYMVILHSDVKVNNYMCIEGHRETAKNFFCDFFCENIWRV